METDYIVVGSGIAGSVMADQLSNSGIRVLVLDKARGSGGRLASKRLTAVSGAQLTIDLGASYLKPKTAAFEQFLAEQQKRGTLAASESAQGNTALVPVSRSSALTRGLLASAQTQFACRVVSIRERQEVEFPLSAGTSGTRAKMEFSVLQRIT